MALAQELNKADNKGPLSEESSGKPFGEVIRDYKPLPDDLAIRQAKLLPGQQDLLPAPHHGPQRGVFGGCGQQDC